MKQWTCLIVLAACGPNIELDVDFAPGPVLGNEGNVTFWVTDGCPGGDRLFGCPDTLPHFAVGAYARIVIGSTTGDVEAEDEVELARPRSEDPSIVQVGRSSDGLILVDAIAPGKTRVNLYADGDVIDSIDVEVEAIEQLLVIPPTTVKLAGAAFPVGVTAYGASRNRVLYARGAIRATALDGLVLQDDVVDYFRSSEQFALRADTALVGTIRVEAGGLADQASLRTITREEITEIAISELLPTSPNANKVRLVAAAKSNDWRVDGGPACDWRIVSGGGPGAALSSSVGDPLADTLFVFDNAAIVFGSGEMVVECRANDSAVAQHTIYFAP